MGVAELRDAFNAVAQPAYTANQVFQSYLHEHDIELQLLQFVGVKEDGTAFRLQSEKLRKNADLVVAAGEAARKLLQEHDKS